jgi:hypothetical protein
VKIKIMAAAAVVSKKEKKVPGQKIPEYLIYEMPGGKPIYYKGYKDVINKTKTFEEIKMESQLQAGLKAEITMLIEKTGLPAGHR